MHYYGGMDDALAKSKEIQDSMEPGNANNDPYAGRIPPVIEEGPEDFKKLMDNRFTPKDT